MEDQSSNPWTRGTGGPRVAGLVRRADGGKGIQCPPRLEAVFRSSRGGVVGALFFVILILCGSSGCSDVDAQTFTLGARKDYSHNSAYRSIIDG